MRLEAHAHHLSMLLGFIVIALSCATTAADSSVRLDALPPCSDDFMNGAAFVAAHQFGIRVENLRHHNIFRFDSKKAPWRPITGYRPTLGGRVEDYYIAEDHADQNEYDWNIDVKPDPAFVPAMGEDVVEAEVTPPKEIRFNSFFPPNCGGDGDRVGKKICLYGPWVLDLGNDRQREIHPSEAIWWQSVEGSNSDVRLLLLQDAAIHRFTETADYDFDEDHDGTNDFHAGWAPWVQYLQTEKTSIPFQYDSHTNRYTVISIDEEQSGRVVTSLDPALADSDDGIVHKLKSGSAILGDHPNPAIRDHLKTGHYR